MILQELAIESRAVKYRFRRLFAKRIKNGVIPPQTEDLTPQERRVYLAYITLKDVKADIETQAKRREELDAKLAALGIPTSTEQRIR